MYNHELTLISHTLIEDEIGNQIPTETRRTILCKVLSVGRNEFYNAAVKDLKPEKVFVIHRYEYEEETLVEFEGNLYSVIRPYATDFEEIEIVCERKIGNG